jgi:hypothetical protein
MRAQYRRCESEIQIQACTYMLLYVANYRAALAESPH